MIGGAGLFLLERVVSRLVVLHHGVRIFLTGLEYYLLTGGTLFLTFCIGLPKAIEGLRTFAQTSDHPLAGLLYQLGFVSMDTCTELLNHGNASSMSSTNLPPNVGAATVATVSLATIISSVLAVLADPTGAPSRKDLGGPVRTQLSKVWALVKKHVVPWFAAALIGAVILVFLLAWTASWTADPEALSRWKFVYLAGGLLLFVQFGTEANRTSAPHHFFRERISFAFLIRVVREKVGPVPYREVLRFSESKPPPNAGPNLVACAVANVSDREVVPAKRGCSPFVFDDEWIGLTRQIPPQSCTPPRVHDLRVCGGPQISRRDHPSSGGDERCRIFAARGSRKRPNRSLPGGLGTCEREAWSLATQPHLDRRSRDSQENGQIAQN